MKQAKTKEITESQLKKWKNARKEINDRKKMLELCLKNMDDALNFENSKLTKTNLVDTLNKIKSLSKESPLIKKEQLKKMTKYSPRELDELIERLKMLGDIYDPYLETTKEGKYLRLM